MSCARVWLAGLAVGLLPGVARADPVDLELRSAVLQGQGKPALILHINKAVAEARIDFARGDGSRLKRRSGRLAQGSRHEFILDAPVGRTTFSGELHIAFADGAEVSTPLTLEVEIAAGFTIDVPEARLELAAGRLQLALSRAAGRCEHEVLYEDKPLRSGVTPFAGEPPGTWLTVSWRTFDPNDLILRIALRCFDAGDVFETGIELYPWKVAVPHEDVVFDSGKWSIQTHEVRKLEAAREEIAKAVARYGRWIQGVKLYVAGHTDTVGAADYNRSLSFKRAASIARYFRDRGVTVPIFFAGFGEDRPAVKTADNIASEANRRAEYIIAVNPPVAARWQPL